LVLYMSMALWICFLLTALAKGHFLAAALVTIPKALSEKKRSR